MGTCRGRVSGGFIRPIDTRPFPCTKAKNDEKSSLAAPNVKNDTDVSAAWWPESFKLFHVDAMAVKSRLYFAKEKLVKLGKVIHGRSCCLLVVPGDWVSGPVTSVPFLALDRAGYL